MKSVVKGIANNFNYCYVDQDQEWIYFFNPLDDQDLNLYKKNKKTFEKIIIFSGLSITNIILYNDLIYFTSDSSIYSIGKYGENLKKIYTIKNDIKIFEFNIYNDFIYFTDDFEYGSLHRIDLNGENIFLISKQSPMDLNIVDNCIYYYGESDSEKGIYKFNLNNYVENKILDGNFEKVNLWKGFLYFVNVKKSYFITRYSILDEEIQILTNDRATHINIFNKFIYYINLSDNSSLYKISLDGTKKMKLVDGLCSNIKIFDEYIYYENILDNHIYSLDMNTLVKNILI
ncbi:DUF5050 domain-containing protein [Peptostreptococcaceae bacterium AGR-M142]